MTTESQVVIVTGGAQGSGFGIGRCFARKGASVVIADLNEGAACKAAEQLRKEGSVDPMGTACDVADLGVQGHWEYRG